MDRFGIFVDAGYLLAAGGDCCLRVVQRDKLVLNFATICAALTTLGTELSGGLDHLRTYWYDAATDRVPTQEHQAVANLSGVKLRLGKLTADGQKGVDSLIVRDLITLGYQRGIATGFLLGGDEDLREGMREAQDQGVKMVLLGINSPRPSVSPSLAQEADLVVNLDKAFLSPHLTRRQELGPRETGRDPAEVGKEFGQSWAADASTEDLSRCSVSRPGLPGALDKELLARGRRS